MTTDEREQLDRIAEELAYQTIKFSGLYKSLESHEWDGLSKHLAILARRAMEKVVEAEFTRLEALQPR